MSEFSTHDLLSTAPEVIDALRGSEQHRKGRLNLAAITGGDYEFKLLCHLATDWCGLDLTGIPIYRVNGEIRGLSTRTKPIEVRWLVADILERIDLARPVVHRMLWSQRRYSIQVCREAASVMLGLRDTALDDQFASFRLAG